MKAKEIKFLESKLLELVDNNIISKKQFNEAKDFFDNKKEKRSISTIFSAIGLFLICLSVITLFAINWDNISREFKCIIAFVPICITSIMLYYYMKNNNKNLERATTIVAPLSILATNSLIGQIFHLQFDVYGLIFISMLMYMPIAFIIRNYLSLVIYGVGCVFYSIYREELFNSLILTLPLIIYNVYNYIKNKEDKKNILLWTLNFIIVTILILNNEILREENIWLHYYIMGLLTKLLFDDKNKLSKFISVIFNVFLIVSCTSKFAVEGFGKIEFRIDTLISMILCVTLFIATKEYKNINKYFVIAFLLFIHIPIIPTNILYILINLIVLSYGIYKIINGRKINSNRIIKQGVALILYLIFVRFVSSEITFMTKSILFLIAGVIFIIVSKAFKQKIEEEKKNEK